MQSTLNIQLWMSAPVVKSQQVLEVHLKCDQYEKMHPVLIDRILYQLVLQSRNLEFVDMHRTSVFG